MSLGNSGVGSRLSARQGLDWQTVEEFSGKANKFLHQELTHSLAAAKLIPAKGE